MVDIPEELEESGFVIKKQDERIESSVANSIEIMIVQADAMKNTYEAFCRTDDERLKDDLSEALSSRLNHFTQAFIDIASYIQIIRGKGIGDNSLGYYKRTVENLDIELTEDGKRALDFLSKRNDLVHDYFNLSQLNQELLQAIHSYGNGFADLAESIKDYCYNKIPAFAPTANIKKAIKAAQRKK